MKVSCTSSSMASASSLTLLAVGSSFMSHSKSGLLIGDKASGERGEFLGDLPNTPIAVLFVGCKIRQQTSIIMHLTN